MCRASVQVRPWQEGILHGLGDVLHHAEVADGAKEVEVLVRRCDFQVRPGERIT